MYILLIFMNQSVLKGGELFSKLSRIFSKCFKQEVEKRVVVLRGAGGGMCCSACRFFCN